MATVTGLPTLLPGLRHSPSLADLQSSGCVYNILKDDNGQPEITKSQLLALAALFTRNNAHESFGIYLVHGHFQIDEGMIMLGVGLGEDPPGSWTKPTKSASVDRNGIHGHIFVMSLLEKRFIAYEYREGPPTDNWKHVHPSFFSELAQYLVANYLADVLGLQVPNRPTLPQELMMEFVLGGESTVMLRQQDVNHGGIYRMTGWSFGRDGNGIISVKGGEAHAQTVQGTHRVFVDKKPLPTLRSRRSNMSFARKVS